MNDTHDFQKVKSKGVDSVGTGFADPAPMLHQLARKERESPVTYYFSI